MAGLLAALATRWPGVADDAYMLLEREGADVYDAAAAVANELTTIGRTGVIVVDDLHLAAPDPALLTAFTEALPDGFRLVAGTRSDPPCRWPGCACAATCSSYGPTISASPPMSCPNSSRCTTSA